MLSGSVTSAQELLAATNQVVVTGTEKTPTRAALARDPRAGKFVVDVFGERFDIIEAAGEFTEEYTGFGYLSEGFWTGIRTRGISEQEEER